MITTLRNAPLAKCLCPKVRLCVERWITALNVGQRSRATSTTVACPLIIIGVITKSDLGSWTQELLFAGSLRVGKRAVAIMSLIQSVRLNGRVRLINYSRTNGFRPDLRNVSRLRRIVFFEPRFRNQIVYLSGDTVTYGQVASILERVLGRPFKRNVWTVPYLIQELEKDPTHHIKKYRAVFAQGRGVAWPKDSTFNEQQSIQVTAAKQWARKNLADN